MRYQLNGPRTFMRTFELSKRKLSSWSSRHDTLFKHTTGRFLFNEELRHSERHLKFDVNALATVICLSVNRPLADLSAIAKLAEGGFNRVLQATFNDGYSVIARLPYRITIPKHYAVASEAATLGFLRSQGVAVPKVLGYSSVDTNPVGVEYLLLEKLEGTPLGDQWFTMDTKTRVRTMRQIVDLEKQFLDIPLPASGSLYYRRDLKDSDHSVPISGTSTSADQIVVGPTAQFEWWYRERALLNIDRGPWTNFLACSEAPAKREIEFCKRYGKSRLHVERYLRELHQFKEMSPVDHIRHLSEYLKLTPHLDIPLSNRFSRPVLRHPDFSPNNILVNSSGKIVGIIDWQHATALPLCLCAGIPKHFQNWGDLLSETLAKPEVKLPDNFQDLPHEEQETIQETMRRRIVHFYYAALTMRDIPDHFDALRNENTMLRAKLFERAGAPWEGDSLSLKYAITQAQQNWLMALPGGKDNKAENIKCPVTYSEEEIQQCADERNLEDEKMEELAEMKGLIGTDSLGWVPDDEHLENAKATVQSIKSGLLEHSSTEIERIAVRDNFPFDDHDEEL